MTPPTFRCDPCGVEFTWRPLSESSSVFALEGRPGVHCDGAWGRDAGSPVFVPDAAACPQCRQLALHKELRELALKLGWRAPEGR